MTRPKASELTPMIAKMDRVHTHGLRHRPENPSRMTIAGDRVDEHGDDQSCGAMPARPTISLSYCTALTAS
jgi:hypothetical protein